MEIQIAALCDAATEYGGKLNILGTFDAIQAVQMPATHPQCSIALRMIFKKIEEGAHKLRLNLVDEDGKLLMPAIDIPVDVGMPDDVNFVSVNRVITIQQLHFTKPGMYSIDMALDGRHEGSIPLLVKKVGNG